LPLFASHAAIATVFRVARGVQGDANEHSCDNNHQHCDDSLHLELLQGANLALNLAVEQQNAQA
jgi:hypothetical protein